MISDSFDICKLQNCRSALVIFTEKCGTISMRMRKKPNLEKRLKECEDLLVSDTENFKGNWKGDFQKLAVELGCGKGSFTLKTAQNNPEVRYIGVEKVDGALLLAMEKIKNACLDNVVFIRNDASHLTEEFEEGEVDTCYINFCDPWPKSRDAKLRLTSPNYLRRCATILKDGGTIEFRTDNLPLFNWSVEQMKNEGWTVNNVTNDADNEIKTDYEKKFFEEGIKINMLTAVKTTQTKTVKDGEVPRLRNAALSDARGLQ